MHGIFYSPGAELANCSGNTNLTAGATTMFSFVAGTLMLVSFLPLAPNRVTVQLAGGRTFTAAVDARSDTNRLWLRFGDGSTTILRPIQWGAITEAKLNGQAVTLEELRQFAREVEPFTASPQPTAKQQPASGESDAQRARQLLGGASRVGDLQVHAILANWDADVEHDGLLVTLRPLDEKGVLSIAGGTVEIKLNAARQDHSRVRGSLALADAGQWRFTIHPDDYQANGLSFRLPFAKSLGEDFASLGLLQVRAVFPGHGVIERELDGVRVKPFSPVRQREYRLGSR